MQEPFYDPYWQSGWQPKVDIYRCADNLLVKLELAGIAEQDLKISVQRNLLAVEGKRRDWCISGKETPFSMEISYDWFRRTIPLPDPILLDAIRTEYRDGMLLVFLTIDKGATP